MSAFQFTAVNAAQFSKQIDKAVKIDPEFCITFGREHSRGTWWLHGAWGGALKTGLTFYEMVDEAQRRWATALDYRRVKT